jgi:hypothetical protein
MTSEFSLEASRTIGWTRFVKEVMTVAGKFGPGQCTGEPYAAEREHQHSGQRVDDQKKLLFVQFCDVDRTGWTTRLRPDRQWVAKFSLSAPGWASWTS